MKTGFHNNVEHPNCIQQIIITGSHDEKEISKLDFLTVSKFKLIHILVKHLNWIHEIVKTSELNLLLSIRSS